MELRQINANDFTVNQQKIYEFINALSKNMHDFITLVWQMENTFSLLPKEMQKTYSELTEQEILEVIHCISGEMLE